VIEAAPLLESLRARLGAAAADARSCSVAVVSSDIVIPAQWRHCGDDWWGKDNLTSDPGVMVRLNARLGIAVIISGSLATLACCTPDVLADVLPGHGAGAAPLVEDGSLDGLNLDLETLLGRC
jgi:hypothetical protein